MGIAIRYCDKCRTRISPGDIESGKALELDDKAYCRKCSKEVRPAPEAEPEKSATPRRVRKSTRVGKRKGNPLTDSNLFNPFQKLPQDEQKARPKKRPTPGRSPASKPAPTTRRQVPSARVQRAEPGKPLSPVVKGVIGGGLILVLILVIVFALVGSDEGSGKPGGSARPEKRPRPKPVKREDRRDKEARKVWKAAFEFAGANPDEWTEVRGRLDEALEAVRGTKYEKRIEERIASGDLEAEARGKASYGNFEQNAMEHWRNRDFDRALAQIQDFKGPPRWLDKAMDLHSRIVDHSRIWKHSRTLPAGNTISPQNKAARASFYGEFTFGLAPALEGDDLTGWNSSGSASWASEKGTLVGTTGAGKSGGIVFGDASWVDYLLSFEFQFRKGETFFVLVHNDENVDSISVSSKSFDPAKWYVMDLIIWGDFAFLFAYDGVRQIGSRNLKSSMRSSKGGFGFQLNSDTEVAFRRVRYRRLNTPGKAWVAPPEGWHALHSKGRYVTGGAVSPSDGSAGAWTNKDEGDYFHGHSETGDLYFLLGSPSWSRFELRFEARNLVKGMVLEVRRPLSPRSMIEGPLDWAEVLLSEEDLPGSDWHQIWLKAVGEEIELLVDGIKKSASKYRSMPSTDVEQPFRMGFRRGSHTGGKVDFRNLQVRVTERDGGF